MFRFIILRTVKHQQEVVLIEFLFSTAGLLWMKSLGVGNELVILLPD